MIGCDESYPSIGDCFGRQCDPLDRIQEWDLEDLSFMPGFLIGMLDNLEPFIASLCGLVSLSVMGVKTLIFIKCFEISSSRVV